MLLKENKESFLLDQHTIQKYTLNIPPSTISFNFIPFTFVNIALLSIKTSNNFFDLYEISIKLCIMFIYLCHTDILLMMSK